MSPCCKHSEKLFLRVAGLHNYETRVEILSPNVYMSCQSLDQTYKKSCCCCCSNDAKPMYDKTF